MFTEIINKLKKKKQELQNLNNMPIEEKTTFDITIAKENNIYKMEISDYISIVDYVERTDLIDEFGVTDMISNGVLWNSKKQKVNKGIYYVLIVDGRLYNIFINGNDLAIDERTKINDITEERIIYFNTITSDYHYFSAKHDKTGSTFYTKYYSKNGFDFGKLKFSKEEAYEEINNVISNLESIEKIICLIDIDLLKTGILNDIGNESLQKKKS
ncbi:MAG: hypothetical protein J6J17_04150 [Bacilli bacterium]|nr:hypothetical protein [Bacilli bacterium]